MTQKFFIPLPPTAQGRPRAYVRGRHAGMYKDSKSRRYEDNLAAILLSHKPEKAPRGTGVKLSLTFYLPRPNGHYGKNGLKPKYEHMPHTGRPDCDNLVKAFKDSAKDILWHDDAQVTEIHATKCYSNGSPGTGVEVSW